MEQKTKMDEVYVPEIDRLKQAEKDIIQSLSLKEQELYNSMSNVRKQYLIACIICPDEVASIGQHVHLGAQGVLQEAEKTGLLTYKQATDIYTSFTEATTKLPTTEEIKIILHVVMGMEEHIAQR